MKISLGRGEKESLTLSGNENLRRQAVEAARQRISQCRENSSNQWKVEATDWGKKGCFRVRGFSEG